MLRFRSPVVMPGRLTTLDTPSQYPPVHVPRYWICGEIAWRLILRNYVWVTSFHLMSIDAKAVFSYEALAF